MGHYLGVEPGSLQFCYGGNGKPAVADEFGGRKLRFNLSNSMGLALYAFTREREIGVDIEYIRDISEMEDIAERYFSAEEKAVFILCLKVRRDELSLTGGRARKHL